MQNMALIEAVTMPKWGMTMTEGTIVQWLTQAGDAVQRGQDLVEIESSKTTNVIEAAADGVLKRILLHDGGVAPVGALIGVIADDAATDAEIDALIARYADRAGSAEAEDAHPAPRSIPVPGGCVNVLEAGAQTVQTVVLIHGFGGDLSTWMFNQDAFAEHFHTVALDLPAHGASPPVAGDDVFNAIVASVAAAVHAIAPGPRHWVGHSFGGAVATALAARDPDKAASLTLIAPVGLGKEMRRDFLTDFIAAERRRPLQSVLERLFSDPTKITSAMVEGALRFKRLEGVPQALSRVADAIANDHGQVCDIAAQIEMLGCPVMILWGEQDAIIPVPKPADMPANAELRTLADVGHMPQMEASSDVNAMVLDHLRRAR